MLEYEIAGQPSEKRRASYRPHQHAERGDAKTNEDEDLAN